MITTSSPIQQPLLARGHLVQVDKYSAMEEDDLLASGDGADNNDFEGSVKYSSGLLPEVDREKILELIKPKGIIPSKRITANWTYSTLIRLKE